MLGKMKRLNNFIGETIVVKEKTCPNCEKAGNIVLVEVYPMPAKLYASKIRKNTGNWKAVCTNCKKRFSVKGNIAKNIVKNHKH